MDLNIIGLFLSTIIIISVDAQALFGQWEPLQVGSWVFLTWLQLSLTVLWFPVWQYIPILFCMFPVLYVVSSISQRSTDSFSWEIVFKKHNLCAEDLIAI